jgi:hypothetical protein
VVERLGSSAVTATVDDLEAVADWRDDLVRRNRRLELRFEFAALINLQQLAVEQDELIAEAEAFKAVCHGIKQMMEGEK